MTSTNSNDTPVNAPVGADPSTSLAPVANTAVAAKRLTTQFVPGKGVSDVAGDYVPADIFCTDVLLYRFPISSSDSPVVDLVPQPNNLWGAYLSNSLVTSRRKGFAFIRGELELTFLINNPGSSIGAYVVSLIPDLGSEAPTEGISNMNEDRQWTSTQVPHVILNCESQTSGSIRLPFIWPQSALNMITPATEVMWRMTIYPLSPLASTITSSAISGTISVYCRLSPGYILETRTYQSSIAASFSRSAGELGNVPVIGSFAKAASSGLAKVSSVLDAFGFTREAAPQTPLPDVIKLVSNMAVVDCDDGSNPLALMSSNSVTIDSAVVGAPSEDCMSFDSLFSKWTIVRTMAINTTMTAGTVFLQVPVTPMLVDSLVDTLTQHSFMTTVPGYVGLPFSYWSGAVQLRVYIPSSTNLQGRIQVFWVPDPAVTVSSSPDPTNWLEGKMIDLSGSSDTVFEIQMAPPNPVRSTHFVQHDDPTPNAAWCNGKLVFMVTQPLTSPLASFVLPVIVMLRGSSSLRFHQPASTLEGRSFVEAVAYQASSDDSSVVQNFVVFSRGSPPDVKSIFFGEEVQSVRALVQKFSPYVRLRLSTTSEREENEFEGASSPFAILPFPPYVSRSFNGAEANEICIPSEPIVPTKMIATFSDTPTYLDQARPLWTWQAHYSLMFAGVRGGTRVKIMPRTMPSRDSSTSTQAFTPMLHCGVLSLDDVWAYQQAVNNVEFSPAVLGFSDIVGWGVPSILNHYDIQGMVGGLTSTEVTVPFYSPYRYVSGRSYASYADNQRFSLTTVSPDGAGALVLAVSPNENLTPYNHLELDLHVAGSSDYSAVMFRRTPRILASRLVADFS